LRFFYIESAVAVADLEQLLLLLFGKSCCSAMIDIMDDYDGGWGLFYGVVSLFLHGPVSTAKSERE
jgi:hypothetical protein